MTPLQLVLVAALLSCCSALKDVVLDIPPVARVGSTVTLRCLYDLEDDKLYAVKWYRGNFEFYRATPNEKPSKQAFAYPDINVDMNLSDEHRVTLRRVPIHMSGNFSCEVSIDAPAFTTVFKSGQLKVLDTVRRPLLTVSKDLYLPGDELEANCTASPEPEEPQPPHPSLGHGGGGMLHGLHLPPLLEQRPPLQPHQLTPEQRAHLRKGAGQAAMTFGFWVNNRPVPAALVEQAAFSAIMLRPVAESDFSASGEMRLKCVVTFADKYREPSHVVTVRRQDTVEEPPVVVDTPAVVAAELPEAADRSSTAGAGAVRFPVPAAALVSVLMALLLLSDGRL